MDEIPDRVGVSYGFHRDHIEAHLTEQTSHRLGRVEVRVLYIEDRAAFAEDPCRPGVDVVVQGEDHTAGTKQATDLAKHRSRIGEMVENLKQRDRIE